MWSSSHPVKIPLRGVPISSVGKEDPTNNKKRNYEFDGVCRMTKEIDAALADGGPPGDRTRDTVIKSHVLYH
jgi:hypothetical protein